MSGHHLRQEKNCLNCGFQVEERYCSRCGQENLEPKESWGHLVGHFFADITHFDSKIFITIKDLVWRPGFLTKEYAEGRRMRYLNPIRMYVFISAIFFLVIYAGGGEESNANINVGGPGMAGMMKDSSQAGKDTSQVGKGILQAGKDTSQAGKGISQAGKAADESLAMHFGGAVVSFDLVENKYKTVREFDSIQAALPDSSREKWDMRWLLRNNLRLKEKHGGRNKLHLETNIQHTIPKLMFILLPLFALYVGMLYSRKRYYYSQHAIFSVHFHSFFFLTMMAAALVSYAFDSIWVGVGLPLLVLLLAFIYLIAALRRIFGQPVWLTFLKACVITGLYAITIFAAFMTVIVITFLTS